jgi:hypothetical protein
MDELRTAFRETYRHHPFTIEAMVVLPDHLHAVWTRPVGDALAADRIGVFAKAFQPATGFQAVAPPKANAASGSSAAPSVPSAVRTFLRVIWIRPYQPARARACSAGQRLATFVVPSYGHASSLSPGIGQATSGTTTGISASGRDRAQRGDGFREELNPSYGLKPAGRARRGRLIALGTKNAWCCRLACERQFASRPPCRAKIDAEKEAP